MVTQNTFYRLYPSTFLISWPMLTTRTVSVLIGVLMKMLLLEFITRFLKVRKSNKMNIFFVC